MDSSIQKRKEKLDKAIKDQGYYGKNGCWNSIITFPGDKTIYRHRVETIVVKDNKYVFVKKKLDGDYRLPGGSVEKDVPNIKQAENEVNEEAHINIRNIESTGITYKEKFKAKSFDDDPDSIKWNGMYTEVYVAEYDSKFKGHIDLIDQDPYILSGRWYPARECFSFFRKEHREALLFYIKNHQENEKPITENYITNYFKNKKFLKNISHNPEVEKNAINQIVDGLKKRYNDLRSTSKIKREMTKDDVGYYFHPVVSLDFKDGSSITFVICFDEKEFTPAAAMYTDDYGYLVVVYPKFFKIKTKEGQIYTLLHEVGHIRLHHTDKVNHIPIFFGKDNDEYRRKLMKKGKVQYVEMNADLYAILNGASMYAILSDTYNKDADDDYDYRFTNAELANRYIGVFNQYNKLVNESVDSEGNYKMIEESVTKYDIACSVIYELAYFDDKTSDLSMTDKNNLYELLYKFTIYNNIKDDDNVIKTKKEYDDALEKYKEKEALYNKYNNICNTDNTNISSSDIDFKNEVESSMSDNDIPELVNDVYILKTRYKNALKNYELARGKAYSNYLNKFDFIAPHSNNTHNSKAIFLANTRYMIKKDVLETVDSLLDRLEIKESVNSESYVLLESISSKERKSIPIELFGIPEERKYPLNSKKHVISAIRLFGHCEPKYRSELAKNILKAMDKYNISTDIIGDKSKLRDYI